MTCVNCSILDLVIIFLVACPFDCHFRSLRLNKSELKPYEQGSRGWTQQLERLTEPVLMTQVRLPVSHSIHLVLLVIVRFLLDQE